MRNAVLALLVLVLFGPPRPAFIVDPLSTAKNLYQSASYDEALALLDRLKADPSELTADDVQQVAQYRVYCLLALGRQADAERAIEEVVGFDPFFAPSDAEVSPRVREAFQAVRRRVLPSAAQQRYAVAKTAFDRKEYPVAVYQFTQLKALLEDKDLAGVDGLGDLRVLAAGFLDLATAANAPPPPAPEPPPPPPAPVGPEPPRVYNASDAGVTQPVAKRQDVPRWPTVAGARVLPNRKGVLDVLINEKGAVESVALRAPVDPRYDELLLAATRGWRYAPATKDGQPVKFLKRINIVVQ